ncbi:membrane protein [Calocera cornea HHB12733]|uniref:Membrane protein n=1 Tax=Calocera cornea HHB12733 TaxID=1353952 RepID=A0A165FL36_9BASI|nr:membrane protein [Calocera cornea HHB12733]
MVKPSRIAGLILPYILATAALHFYLDSTEKKCFIEELPTDTVVEGHYRAQEWSETAQTYEDNPELGVQIDVDELSTGHSVVKTRGPPDGKFTFSSHDAGDHSICLSTNYTSNWLSSRRHIRMYLDIVVGATRRDVEHDRSHISDLAQRVRDLNFKLQDIRREQQFQREREAAFRDLSEQVNSRAVWYCTVQIVVLFVTCAWQLRHLRRFFEDKKIR